ncbi:hypothetical protein [Corynebacterium nasicanis]|uniref:Uncharacterized protein n=1 Tax=Corynebacterium nasicanis TaxID=1448267 RepID=A0ABW1QFR8_9CORY
MFTFNDFANDLRAALTHLPSPFTLADAQRTLRTIDPCGWYVPAHTHNLRLGLSALIDRGDLLLDGRLYTLRNPNSETSDDLPAFITPALEDFYGHSLEEGLARTTAALLLIAHRARRAQLQATDTGHYGLDRLTYFLHDRTTFIDRILALPEPLDPYRVLAVTATEIAQALEEDEDVQQYVGVPFACLGPQDTWDPIIVDLLTPGLATPQLAKNIFSALGDEGTDSREEIWYYVEDNFLHGAEVTYWPDFSISRPEDAHIGEPYNGRDEIIDLRATLEEWADESSADALARGVYHGWPIIVDYWTPHSSEHTSHMASPTLVGNTYVRGFLLSGHEKLVHKDHINSVILADCPYIY